MPHPGSRDCAEASDAPRARAGTGIARRDVTRRENREAGARPINSNI